jgi:hypothetical protein
MLRQNIYILGDVGEPLKLHATFLRQAQYHLKTKLGLSDEFYSNLDLVLHGTGQGSKASPVIWVAISSVILILIEQQPEGVTMVDPECIEHLKRWMDGFVDDTTAWLNQFCAELRIPAEDFSGTVTEKLQAMAQ